MDWITVCLRDPPARTSVWSRKRDRSATCRRSHKVYGMWCERRMSADGQHLARVARGEKGYVVQPSKFHPHRVTLAQLNIGVRVAAGGSGKTGGGMRGCRVC